MFRKWLPYFLGALALYGLFSTFRPKPALVDAARAHYAPLTVTVLEEGKTRIRHRYLISPPIPGYLNRVALRAGDRIEAGKTVLATIQSQPSTMLDPRARAEAEARVKAAEAARFQRETMIERARAALDLAQRELERAESLKQRGAIAAQEWDAAENQVAVLTREVHGAEFALKIAEFELKQAQAALDHAADPAAATGEPLQLIAPVDGYVLNVFEESARVVAAGQQIMEVGDPRDLEAEIELLSSDAVAVREGAEVWIEQWGGATPLKARVSVVEPGGFTKISALGVEEQRVKVRVDLSEEPPEDRRLGDRYRVEARIVTWHGDRVLQIPTGALFRRGNQWSAFVIEHGRARRVPLKVGQNNGATAQILEGIEEGASVIVHPPDSIRDGGSVAPKGISD